MNRKKAVLARKVDLRKSFNTIHKNKQLDDKLKETKNLLKKEEDECPLMKNAFDSKLKQMKQALSKKVTDENEADEECGKVHHVKNQFERKTLCKCKVKVTAHHSGDLEGNSIRRLIGNGDEIYQDMSDYVCQMRNEKKIGNENDTTTNEEN